MSNNYFSVAIKNLLYSSKFLSVNLYLLGTQQIHTKKVLFFYSGVLIWVDTIINHAKYAKHISFNYPGK